jgi:hypothetical protein
VDALLFVMRCRKSSCGHRRAWSATHNDNAGFAPLDERSREEREEKKFPRALRLDRRKARSLAPSLF